MSKLYRQRPVTVEAIQFVEDPAEILAWVPGSREGSKGILSGGTWKNFPTVVIPTIKGNEEVVSGDYVVKGAHGFYVLDSWQFESSFEDLV
jgi:hypothetical protein